MTFEPVPGTETTFAADLVLLAMGFTGPETATLTEQTGADLTGRGLVAMRAVAVLSERSARMAVVVFI